MRHEVNMYINEVYSKKQVPISCYKQDISNIPTCRDDINSTSWIEWKSVGVRDAVKPLPLIDARLMDGSKEIIQPEYSNQTVSY